MPHMDLTNALVEHLPDRGVVWLSSCSAESGLLHNALMAAGPDLGALMFTGVFVPNLNRRTYLVNDQARVQTYFMTPQLKSVSERVDFLPLCYSDILKETRRRPPDAALVMVSPPDENGVCSLGTECHFLGDLWPDIPVLIGHVNPNMPKTSGQAGIPLSAFIYYVEHEHDLLETPAPAFDKTAKAIAEHIAPFIPDGATLQLGLGKIPGAILHALKDHKNLGLHSGLVGPDVLELERCGALKNGASVTVGVAIGTRDLYDAVKRDIFSFQPVSTTHNAEIMANKAPFIAINSAFAVDLFGQVYAEATPSGFMSGPGGASDFARGVKLAQAQGCQQSLSIIALPSTEGKSGAISRIIAPNTGVGPVSLGRRDVDLIVSENGIADLRGGTLRERAQNLIAIAADEHQEVLKQSLHEYSWG